MAIGLNVGPPGMLAHRCHKRGVCGHHGPVGQPSRHQLTNQRHAIVFFSVSRDRLADGCEPCPLWDNDECVPLHKFKVAVVYLRILSPYEHAGRLMPGVGPFSALLDRMQYVGYPPFRPLQLCFRPCRHSGLCSCCRRRTSQQPGSSRSTNPVRIWASQEHRPHRCCQNGTR